MLRRLIVVFCGALVNCGPSICFFEAKPNRICRGDVVTLSWHASRDGTITSSARGAVSSSVSQSGTKQVSPPATVRYRLEVSNLFGSAARDVDVEVANGKTGAIGQSVSPTATCVGTALGVTALAPAALVSSSLSVGAVTTLDEDSHVYHIEHAGKSADLSPGAATNAFEGTPLCGPWKLSVTLLPGEQCATPSLPVNLGVKVAALCDVRR
jgi:hypothetical protein